MTVRLKILYNHSLLFKIYPTFTYNYILTVSSYSIADFNMDLKSDTTYAYGDENHEFGFGDNFEEIPLFADE